MPNKVTNDFLPSSRSIAFQKNAWKKVGGYPERLNTCEDLVFARNMKKSKLNFYVAKEAVVYWPQRKNILEAFGQFFSYAKGDGEAFYIRWSTPFLFARFVMVIILLLLPINLLLKIFILQILLIMYFGWSVYKNYKYIKNLRALFYLPLLQVISDIAVFFGMTTGIFKRIM